MPSKGKKHAKTQSRLSTSDVASPRTPPLTPNRDSDVSEEELILSCEEASKIYPPFIGKSAFVGDISAVELKSKGCKIWLSEPSMVSFSLAPGSIVSVSFPCSRRENLDSDSFPLKSLMKECAGCYGLDYGNTSVDGAGNYFALATVFPSSKVLKNGVQISSELSYTMGCPTIGTHVFVYPVQNQCLSSLINEKNEPQTIEDNSLVVYNCKELYLQLAPLKNGLPMKISNLSPMDLSAAKSHLQFGIENVTSPKTPSNGLKLSSLSDLSSPIFEDSSSSTPNQKSQSLISFDLREALGDESSKKLLQTCAASWLYSRWLLLGNIVTIQIFSELCVFQVVGAKRVSVDRSIPDSSIESGSSYPEGPDISEHINQAIIVNHETKVSLSLPSNVTSDELIQRDLSKVELREKGTKASVPNNVSKLGGLSKEYAVLKDIILSSVKNDLLSNFGLRTTKGVLLHGPPGTGKTSLAQLCAYDVGVNIFQINGPEIVGQYYGESEQALHEVFDSAIQAAPAVVFIDELDAIAPARKDGGDELSQRMVATLLNLMDGICRTEGLLVIAATNRPDNIEPALRRPGRFDKEIEIGVPSPYQRLDMLLTLLSEVDHTLTEIQIEHLATVTHGFVGADLVALCKEAGLVCLRRYFNFKKDWHNCCYDGTSSLYKGQQHALLKGAEDSRDHSGHSTSSVSELSTSSVSELSVASNSLLPSCMIGSTSDNIGIPDRGEDHNLKVTCEDFQKARMIIRPSAMREVILEVPKVKWEDVGGQKDVKAQLMEAVEWPQKHHDALKRIGTHPPKGVLMFGPPGCSKTLMARAVASEAALNFLAVKGPELFSKWVGESEKAVRSLFAKARANAPSIVFFDEIDGLAVTRGKESDGVSVSDRVMSQLLVELDGLHERANVTVIAATNRPDKIDPALLRPGRFDRLLYVGPPNEIDREEIFRIHLHKIPRGSDVSLKELASLTDGFTGADISLICREAAVAAIEESLKASAITMKHLKTAIKQVQPTEIQSYQQLSAKFQRAVSTSVIKHEASSMQCSNRSTWPSVGKFIRSLKLFLYRISVAIFI
ncbi:hypothetical protein QN277_013417 [Acacia crassicarpa]|uniref:AAA+ ATPase domain-containing protein n=1 Tax=Acacia crassicarpa TaxID=499986 RepID=A0AAE1N3A5_9FABA|nr:hypothetical protein QN277_013417 [Acacia crassicarpa]